LTVAYFGFFSFMTYRAMETYFIKFSKGKY
jgi:hypothetical protein